MQGILLFILPLITFLVIMYLDQYIIPSLGRKDLALLYKLT
jgi:hypothetical protein